MVVGTQAIFLAPFGALERFYYWAKATCALGGCSDHFDLEQIMRLVNYPWPFTCWLGVSRHILYLFWQCLHRNMGLWGLPCPVPARTRIGRIPGSWALELKSLPRCKLRLIVYVPGIKSRCGVDCQYHPTYWTHDILTSFIRRESKMLYGPRKTLQKYKISTLQFSWVRAR